MAQMESSTTSARPFTILVADDAGDSRQLLVRLLQRFTRSDIKEVRDGAQALSTCRSLTPDMVLLDIDMPEMDGLSVLREIRAADPRAFIVIVTGISSMKNVNEALALGASAFVVKLYSARRIIEVVKKCEKHSGRPLLIQEEQ